MGWQRPLSVARLPDAALEAHLPQSARAAAAVAVPAPLQLAVKGSSSRGTAGAKLSTPRQRAALPREGSCCAGRTEWPALAAEPPAGGDTRPAGGGGHAPAWPVAVCVAGGLTLRAGRRQPDGGGGAPGLRPRWRGRRRDATGVARLATLEQSPTAVAEPPEAAEEVGAGSAPAPAGGEADVELDILQFDAAVYYVEEKEEVLHLDIVRLGSMTGVVKVSYRTEDGSAIAGVRYEAVQGDLVFQPGDVCKTISVPIISTDRWNTTLEFKIRLFNPENCELGRYLFLSRVKVIDNDCFPTNRFAEEIEKYGAGNLTANGVADTDLTLEYFKLNYTIPGIKEKTWAALIIDQLQNIYYYLTINLVKYIADDVLGPNPENPLLVPENRELTLLLVGALFLVPYGLLNLLELWKASLQIAETSQEYLQENIFRKFSNYSESTRSRVNQSEMSLVMVQDVNDIVENGYMKIFEIAKYFGKLLVSSYFIVGENSDAAIPLLIGGIGIAIFVVLNYRKNVAYNEEVSDRQAEIMDVVQETNQKYRLIADYYMRPQVQEVLEVRARSLKEALMPAKTASVTNDYFPGWISTILVALYVSIGGDAVVTGTLQIGAFLATINAVKDIGDSFKDIFVACLDVGKAIGPIQKVTELMNMPTSLLDMKRVNRERRRMTKQERRPERLAELRRVSGQRFGTDAIPIALRNVSFAYPAGSGNLVLKSVDLNVPQGSLVGVVGSRRGGKSTFMKLLGHVLYPTSGEYFVPSYLRILHVSEDPMTLDRGLWANLAIGREYWRDEAFESERVLRICRRLGLSKSIINKLEKSRERFFQTGEEQSDWQFTLSTSDMVLIHLARAFIYNPEVLVMNRPTTRLPDMVASQVLCVLKEFVANRGVELPPADAGKRRPRTAFVSFVRLEGVHSADVVWKVEAGNVSVVDKDDVSPILIG